jgi:hypothetical protein
VSPEAASGQRISRDLPGLKVLSPAAQDAQYGIRKLSARSLTKSHIRYIFTAVREMSFGCPLTI